MITLKKLKKELREIADPKKAKLLQRFFKTRKGEYGEGDVFLGITVPQSRKIAKKYYSLDIKQLKELIASKFHEERLIALFILINKYRTINYRGICFHFYLKNMRYIDNWDLVDLSAPNIIGDYLFRGPVGLHPRPTASVAPLPACARRGSPTPATPELLINLARSKNVWERRIAVLATFKSIKENQFKESLEIAELLLKDKHDLIHKAIGWMLREIGKRDLDAEIKFLNKHYSEMPRTMLRYAIERFPENLRTMYLNKN